MKLQIFTAGNVLVPAYLVLLQKGYAVRCEATGDDHFPERWIAENETTELIAEDVLSLLALAAIAESRGANWQAPNDEIDKFLKKFGYEDAGS